MTVSVKPLDSHFIAINAHSHHAPDAILRAARSVAIAVDTMVAARVDPVVVALFHHATLPLPAHIQTGITALGISLQKMGPGPNGGNLNRQIELALAAGHGLFYRVDADDTVHPQRFLRQAALMADGRADISGGGLIYVTADHARPVRPGQIPAPLDYLLNRAALHPTLCLRLSSLADADLRYWSYRLEDKALIGAALKAGLTVRNDQEIYGTYHLRPDARSGPGFAALNLFLNLRFLSGCGHFRLLPHALALFVAGAIIPTRLLRRLRDGRALPLQGETQPQKHPA